MGAHFAQKIVEIESDLSKSMRASQMKDSTLDFAHLNGSVANAMDNSTRDMGSTTVANKQTLTGMYLTADAQGGASSKPLDNYLDVPGVEVDTSTALVKQVRL